MIGDLNPDVKNKRTPFSVGGIHQMKVVIQNLNIERWKVKATAATESGILVKFVNVIIIN